jgi:spermidine/putrescine transport system ATP-binding protein
MSTPTAVELQGVTKRFGEVRAVDGVSLQVADGEFFSLLGPSGCGKTTTLRMIAGFEMPSEGEILIQGRAMSRMPSYRRNVNTVFQSYALFPHLTVAQNIEFGLEMHHVPAGEKSKRVVEVLRLVRLEGYGPRKPRELSGGQQQRVALARALVNEPAVLLLDEPLGALDLKLRKELQLELRALQDRVGITFIYVTHDQEEALTMSHRIAVMSQGRVLQVGTPAEIYERPSCRFVADFIGESNFLEGTVRSAQGPRVTVDAGEGVSIEGVAHRAVEIGSRVMVSVRPEKAHLARIPPGRANVFAAQVERVVYVGADTRIFTRIGGRHGFVIKEQNDMLSAGSDGRYAVGETVYVTWPVENAFVLTE